MATVTKTGAIQKTLDYWFTIEFLDQQEPEFKSTSKKLREYSHGWDLIRLKEQDFSCPLESIINKEAQKYSKTTWGDMTLYIGKVSRERCIEYIQKFLPVKSDEQQSPERNTNYISCVSLQLSQKGVYIKGTLSVSPILWAISKLDRSGGDFSDLIDERLYKQEMNCLADEFFGPEHKDDPEQDEPDEEAPSGESYPLFSEYAVTLKTLQDLFDYIESNYIQKQFGSEGQGEFLKEQYLLYLQLFKDEETRKKYEDKDYNDLAKNFYTEDLRLILDKTQDGSLHSAPMGEDIEKYILAFWQRPERERMDLVEGPKSQDRDSYLRKIIDILDVKIAPLGKWPSSFMPTFMQQIAINLTIGKTDENFGKIFSVNGPPGTGKTTLVKEIVASNVVDRAILLSCYENPDDAFEKHAWKDCPQDDKFKTSWYSLKDDRINDYSILVASNNNAAVENISLQLPIIDLKDLTPSDTDSENVKDSLKEIQDLFTPSKTGTTEIWTNFGQEKVPYDDIYFTKYAEDLLNNKKTDDPKDSDDADDKIIWGLASAALGKLSNQGNFYRNVLKPYLYDNAANKTIQNALEKYKTARQEFKEQLNIVLQMQDRLHNLSRLLDLEMECKEELNEAERLKSSQEKVHKQAMLDASDKIKEIEESYEYKSYQEQSQEYQDRIKRFERNINELDDKIQPFNDQKDSCLYEIREQKRSIHWWVWLFNRSRYDEAKKNVELIQQEMDVIEKEIEGLRRQKDSQERGKQTNIAKKNENDKHLREIDHDIKQQRDLIDFHNHQLDQEEQDCLEKGKKYRQACYTYKEEAQKFKTDQEDSCTIMDEAFFDDLFYGDETVSKEAQISNPWFTERYNREREKLFALAMRLNKEFVLSSKSCRSNFKLLSWYWNGVDEGNRKIEFKQDKEKIIPALFQTLFLLVPVISTTFASVGAMFKDVKESGTIGLLVVDEAGQAEPQIALGALYRCRKAVIIGDPKQIEPVVTEDLGLLKKAFKTELPSPYTDDTVSAQNFADQLNCFGTYLDRKTDNPEWVGCPLLVCRRCISPMYDISNIMSYDGDMKNAAQPPKAADERRFVCRKSQWFDVSGKERGNRNHFVDDQGEKICELLETAFEKHEDGEPDIFIISPFKTVVAGVIEYIEKDKRLSQKNKDYLINEERIGTVHTFQGKEADEVIFVLGCDQDSLGAVHWVKKNLVNVAVTRAKYRLYIIGDREVWGDSQFVEQARTIMEYMEGNSENKFQEVSQ